jgi:hypothetical protein
LYGYVNGNPLSYIDQGGQIAIPIVIAAVAVAIATTTAALAPLIFKHCMTRCGCERIDKVEDCNGSCSRERYGACAKMCGQYIGFWGFFNDPIGSASSQIGQEVGKKNAN